MQSCAPPRCDCHLKQPLAVVQGQILHQIESIDLWAESDLELIYVGDVNTNSDLPASDSGTFHGYETALFGGVASLKQRISHTDKFFNQTNDCRKHM